MTRNQHRVRRREIVVIALAILAFALAIAGFVTSDVGFYILAVIPALFAVFLHVHGKDSPPSAGHGEADGDMPGRTTGGSSFLP